MEITEKSWEENLKDCPEFLQSWSWGEFQKKMGVKIWRLNAANNLQALVLKKNLPMGKSYLYIPRGPYIKDLDVFLEAPEIIGEFLEKIKKIARQEKAVFLKIEPLDNNQKLADFFNQRGFVKSDKVQPVKTRLIDLSLSEEKILASMEHDTRYAIRAAQKRGVEIVKDIDTDALYDLLQETSARQKIKIYSREYFQYLFSGQGDIKVEIFLAGLEEKPIAGALILFYHKRAVYLYAAYKSGYGKFNAPSFILWEAIKEAKKRGADYFDFWGVDEDNENWAGLTAFKKSFGGKEYVYPGARDYVLDGKFYLMYKWGKKLRDFFEK